MTIEDDDLAPCDGEGTATVSFPAKLRCMLEEAEVMGLENIISWEMNGTAFRVHKSDDFVEVIMGRWFNQTKYKSFQRVSLQSTSNLCSFELQLWKANERLE